MEFEKLTPEQLREIWDKTKNITIEVKEEIVGFSTINVGKTPIEVPPTPLAFFKENFVQIILHTSDDFKGRWIRFVLFVYAKGGKIFFTKNALGNYDAEIRWH